MSLSFSWGLQILLLKYFGFVGVPFFVSRENETFHMNILRLQYCTCVYMWVTSFHDMLLIKCITCNLIGAKITVCDGCWCSSWSKNDSFFSLKLTFSVGKFYKCMINCVTTKHACVYAECMYAGNINALYKCICLQRNFLRVRNSGISISSWVALL